MNVCMQIEYVFNIYIIYIVLVYMQTYTLSLLFTKLRHHHLHSKLRPNQLMCKFMVIYNLCEHLSREYVLHLYIPIQKVNIQYLLHMYIYVSYTSMYIVGGHKMHIEIYITFLNFDVCHVVTTSQTKKSQQPGCECINEIASNIARARASAQVPVLSGALTSTRPCRSIGRTGQLCNFQQHHISTIS